MTVDPDRLLDALSPVGWKLGLERMHLLSDELGRPQDAFESIHVVGTNGKTSVTRMTAAIATAHGVRTGCSVSPHLDHWSERVLIEGVEIEADRFGEAVNRASRAAERVNRELGPEESLTQFELATAAGFVALADAGVELAVIEAGLGGRLDATNTIKSRATVLTSIGLDHTENLGDNELAIAAEKLAVLRPGTVLVTGRLSPEVEDLARRTADRVGARLLPALAEGPDLTTLRGPAAPFQRENFRVAEAAASTFLERLDPALTARAAGHLSIPGRLERIGDDPPTFVDVAHNRPGAAALARALPEVTGEGPVVACIAVLADKDAAGMLAELSPVIARGIFTTLPPELLAARGRPGARAHDPADLVSLAAAAGIPAAAEPDPVRAIERTRDLAAECGGTALIAGSHFLLSADS